MTQFRTIEIDFEIHRIIEMNRTGFDESPRQVLRRLLGLSRDDQSAAISAETTGRSWFGQGVELPHGTDLRMSYNAITHVGCIVDGVWIVAGERHTTPSGAAIAVARTRDGEKTNLNGWNYWEARLPGSQQWAALNALYRDALERKQSA